MRKQEKGFSLIELLVVVAIILIIAAIAIPSLLNARKSAQQSAAAGTVRAFNSAEATYASKYNNGFVAPDVLIAPAGGCDAPNMFPGPANAAGWSAAPYTYTFGVAGSTPADPNTAGGCTVKGTPKYELRAAPTDATDTTLESYFVDDSGTVRHGIGSVSATSTPLGR